MANNLAAYFAQGNSEQNKQMPNYDDMGPTVSMAVHADDDDHFKSSTFNLKRTRSMGLLDPYIDDTQKLLVGASDPNTSQLPSDILNQEGDVSRDDFNEYDLDNDIDYDYDYMEHDASHSPPNPETDDFLMHHDDNDLMYEPNRHVDYLSHKWNEKEISQSWKYIILKKKKKDTDLINAARLENASWRTWAKARNNLNTVNPESLNWSKDSDVTWLYGPIVRDQPILSNPTSDTPSKKLHEEPKPVCDEKAGNITIGYGSDDETSKRLVKSTRARGPKPILKKRTVSEIIEENSKWRLDIARQHRKHLLDSSAILDSNSSHIDHDDFDAIAAKVNSQYYKGIDKHSTGSNESMSPDDGLDTVSSLPPASSGLTTGSPLDLSSKIDTPKLSSILSTSPKQKDKKDRHIHFNNRVDQCISVDVCESHDDMAESNSSDESDNLSGQNYNEARDRIRGGTRYHDAYMGAEDNTDEDMYYDEDDDDEDDDDGLFISATIRKDNISSRGSDSSDIANSLGSLSISKFSNSIIKPLPATTLNYGSDDEYDHQEDEDWYYGNAVSHNVNTSRGFDYMYDYNTVYTGDTSNFMTVNNSCDIIDVPDGMGLDAAMDAGSAESPKEESRLSPFLFNNDHEDESSSDDAFIENSVDHNVNSMGEDVENDDIKGPSVQTLKRVSSLGKNRSNSLHDLAESDVGPSNLTRQTHSFITGKSLNQDVRQTIRPPLRSRSSSSFLFDSDSEEDSS